MANATKLGAVEEEESLEREDEELWNQGGHRVLENKEINEVKVGRN